jgi:hypothetical protein
MAGQTRGKGVKDRGYKAAEVAIVSIVSIATVVPVARRGARDGVDRRTGRVAEARARSDVIAVVNGRRSLERAVPPGRLAEHRRLGKDVRHVVGELVGHAEGAPQRHVRPRRDTAHERAERSRSLEERGGLSGVVRGELDVLLELPCLAGNEADPRPGRLDERQHRRHAELGATRETARERVERLDHEAIPHEHGHGFAIHAVHGGSTAANVGRVEARQVVVNERRAMEELDRARRGMGDLAHVAPATGASNLEAQARTDPCATGEDGIRDRFAQQARRTAAPCDQGFMKGTLEHQIDHIHRVWTKFV